MNHGLNDPRRRVIPPGWLSLGSFRVTTPYQGILTRTVLQAARSRGAVALLVSGHECMGGQDHYFGAPHHETPETEGYDYWLALQESLTYNGYVGMIAGMFLFTDEQSPERFSRPYEIRALDKYHCGVCLDPNQDPSTFTRDYFPVNDDGHPCPHHYHERKIPLGFAVWNGKTSIT